MLVIIPCSEANLPTLQSISRRLGWALISIIFPYSTVALMTSVIFTGYPSLRSNTRPVGCPSIVTYLFLRALMSLLVASSSVIVNLLWIEATTKSNREHLIAPIQGPIRKDIDLSALENAKILKSLI